MDDLVVPNVHRYQVGVLGLVQDLALQHRFEGAREVGLGAHLLLQDVLCLQH
jgi:hypothetical protein